MSKATLSDYLASLGYTNIPLWLQWLLGLSDIVLILSFAWLAHWLINRFLKTVFRGIIERENSPEQRLRIKTLDRVFHYCANLLIFAIAFMLVLSALGISIAPILATAGVVGLAVGFGTQSLVKDYFTGLVLLIENQIRVGDYLELCGKFGVVEGLTLRYVRLRDYDGTVHFIPNGAITFVTSHSRQFAYAVFNIGVAYKEDLEQVFTLMRQTANELRQSPSFKDFILDDIEISGVDNWAESSITIRARMKTMALQQWAVRREYLLRLKQCFDVHGIEIPFPHRTVYTVPAPQS